MVTSLVRHLIDNIFNVGNPLGLDPSIIRVYFAKDLINDSQPDILLIPEYYTVLGGFYEAFLDAVYSGRLVGGIIDTMKLFSENIKDFEREILARTRPYIDSLNTIAMFLRNKGLKVRILISENTTGSELLLMGRGYLVRKIIDRKLNEILSEGTKKILFESIIDYILFDRYTQHETLEYEPLARFLDIGELEKSPCIIFEPIDSVAESLPIKESRIILSARDKIIGLGIPRDRFISRYYPPFSYEQLFLLEPRIAVEYAKHFLSSSAHQCIVAMRRSTYAFLNYANESLRSSTKIRYFVDFLGG